MWIGLIMLAGIITVVTAIALLGWVYEGPKRAALAVVCWVGVHGLSRSGVNPENQNTERQCIRCARFMA